MPRLGVDPVCRNLGEHFTRPVCDPYTAQAWTGDAGLEAPTSFRRTAAHAAALMARRRSHDHFSSSPLLHWRCRTVHVGFIYQQKCIVCSNV